MGERLTRIDEMTHQILWSFLKKKGEDAQMTSKIGEEGLNSLQKSYKGFLFFFISTGSVCSILHYLVQFYTLYTSTLFRSFLRPKWSFVSCFEKSGKSKTFRLPVLTCMFISEHLRMKYEQTFLLKKSKKENISEHRYF